MPEHLLQERLYPVLPPGGQAGVLLLPDDEAPRGPRQLVRHAVRRAGQMMREHGKSGRTFAGRVVQLITGSTGLDDYEWGVTLFATTPEVVKDVVYTLRFDKGSALYGEFGRFYVGYVAPLDTVLDALTACDRHDAAVALVDARRVEREHLEAGHLRIALHADLNRASGAVVVDVAVGREQLQAIRVHTAGDATATHLGDLLRHRLWVVGTGLHRSEGDQVDAVLGVRRGRDRQAPPPGWNAMSPTPWIRSRTSAGRLSISWGDDGRRMAPLITMSGSRSSPATSPIAESSLMPASASPITTITPGSLWSSSVAVARMISCEASNGELGDGEPARLQRGHRRFGQRPPVHVVEVGDRRRPGSGLLGQPGDRRRLQRVAGHGAEEELGVWVIVERPRRRSR